MFESIENKIPKFCADYTRKISEPLIGTAARVDIWFVLEYSGPFGSKAFEESNIPQSVKIYLQNALTNIPNSRLQLIKRGPKTSATGHAFFVAVSHEEKPNLYEFNLPKYEDLLSLDLQGIAAEQRKYWEHDRTTPLYLVCTNGKRDQCCARYGLPVYKKLRKLVEEPRSVWQTSHIGGHRFAANTIILPYGLVYGFLNPENLDSLVKTQQNQKLLIKHYRGRACYEKRVQAAEALLRQESEEYTLNVFKLVEIEVVKENEWIFHFVHLVSGISHCVQVRASESDFKVLKSCNDRLMVHVPQYTLVDYQQHVGLKWLE